jgi:hypothetical protein
MSEPEKSDEMPLSLKMPSTVPQRRPETVPGWQGGLLIVALCSMGAMWGAAIVIPMVGEHFTKDKPVVMPTDPRPPVEGDAAIIDEFRQYAYAEGFRMAVSRAMIYGNLEDDKGRIGTRVAVVYACPVVSASDAPDALVFVYAKKIDGKDWEFQEVDVKLNPIDADYSQIAGGRIWNPGFFNGR